MRRLVSFLLIFVTTSSYLCGAIPLLRENAASNSWPNDGSTTQSATKITPSTSTLIPIVFPPKRDDPLRQAEDQEAEFMEGRIAAQDVQPEAHSYDDIQTILAVSASTGSTNVPSTTLKVEDLEKTIDKRQASPESPESPETPEDSDSQESNDSNSDENHIVVVVQRGPTTTTLPPLPRIRRQAEEETPKDVESEIQGGQEPAPEVEKKPEEEKVESVKRHEIIVFNRESVSSSESDETDETSESSEEDDLTRNAKEVQQEPSLDQSFTSSSTTTTTPTPPTIDGLSRKRRSANDENRKEQTSEELTEEFFRDLEVSVGNFDSMLKIAKNLPEESKKSKRQVTDQEQGLVGAAEAFNSNFRVMNRAADIPDVAVLTVKKDLTQDSASTSVPTTTATTQITLGQGVRNSDVDSPAQEDSSSTTTQEPPETVDQTPQEIQDGESEDFEQARKKRSYNFGGYGHSQGHHHGHGQYQHGKWRSHYYGLVRPWAIPKWYRPSPFSDTFQGPIAEGYIIDHDHHHDHHHGYDSHSSEEYGKGHYHKKDYGHGHRHNHNHDYKKPSYDNTYKKDNYDSSYKKTDTYSNDYKKDEYKKPATHENNDYKKSYDHGKDYGKSYKKSSEEYGHGYHHGHGKYGKRPMFNPFFDPFYDPFDYYRHRSRVQ